MRARCTAPSGAAMQAAMRAAKYLPAPILSHPAYRAAHFEVRDAARGRVPARRRLSADHRAAD
eukprot:8777035-Lingulodinium_polyedra.AAC.1